MAVDEEIKSCIPMRTWTAKPIPDGKPAIPVRWSCKVKKDAYGSIEGFRQTEGVDSDEVIAPVSKYYTVVRSWPWQLWRTFNRVGWTSRLLS